MATNDIGEPVEGSGWRALAGTMILLSGLLNITSGAVALADRAYFDQHLVVGDVRSWGWTFLIFGIVELLVAMGIYGGHKFAVFLGVLLAGLNAVGQLLFMHAYPGWSIVVIFVDLLVIYGLTAHGTVHRR